MQLLVHNKLSDQILVLFRVCNSQNKEIRHNSEKSFLRDLRELGLSCHHGYVLLRLYPKCRFFKTVIWYEKLKQSKYGNECHQSLNNSIQSTKYVRKLREIYLQWTQRAGIILSSLLSDIINYNSPTTRVPSKGIE